MTVRTRLIAAICSVVVVLSIGAIVGVRALVHRFDTAIPQADLLPDEPGSGPVLGDLGDYPAPPPAEEGPIPGSDIKGPLNILIAGEDRRSGEPVPHSDTIVIMHINADLTKVWLVSLPRDLLVNVPAFPPSGSGADFTKITHAMAYGSEVPGSTERNVAQGFQLLAQTVSGYTGIPRFDAGAMVSFNGLKRLGDVLGGIDIYVDHYVASIHMGPDGYDREWCPPCEHLYRGPQAEYHVGMMHLAGWQILDYSRQRYGLPNGAYDRDRHHRQIIKAMVEKIMSFDIVAHPFVPDYVAQALGEMLTLDLQGRALHEWAYALRNLRPEAITLVGLPGGGVSSGGAYLGEQLQPIQAPFFQALVADNLDAFLAANPTLVDRLP